MKRNMVPLLGIAFVVAIISTGVFYGLFAGKLRSACELPAHSIVVAARDLDRGTVIQRSDVRMSEVRGLLGGVFSKAEDAAGATLLTSLKANEPLLVERVEPRGSEAGASGARVPAGMRAMSMRVSQSEGLLNLMLPGSRVDVQAFSEKPAPVELRTVLENVQVVEVSPPDTTTTHGGGTVVTVLVPAQAADVVALADAGSRIRVALRNPQDQGATPQRSLPLGAVFSPSVKSASLKREVVTAQSSEAANSWDHPVQLHVRVLDASEAAVTELSSQTTDSSSNDAWRVAAFRDGDDAPKLIDSLEQKHLLEVVSSERLMAGIGRPISYRAGAKPSALRVRFSPEWSASGKLGLQVQSEISVPSGLGTARNKYDAGLQGDSSFLMQSFWKDPDGQNLPARLFPKHSWERRHLVIFVSVRRIQQAPAAVVARAEGGR